MRVAGYRPFREHVECPVSLPYPSHRVVYSPGPESFLREQESITDFADEVVGGYPDDAVGDLGVIAVSAKCCVRMTHRRHVAQDFDARRGPRYNEHRRAPMRLCVRVGHRHNNKDVGDRAVRGKPLATVG